MRLVSTAAEVRELDRATIEDLGVPGVALMETASVAVARAVRDHFGAQAERGVVVVCGGGNNGGDGYCSARWLHGWDIPVRLWCLSETSPGDAGINRAVCDRLGIPEVDGLGDAGLIVDAVFGTGLARAVTGRYADVIDAINAHPAPVVAVDVPSGLSADTGAVLGTAVRADRTLTFGRAKLGLYGEPGADLTGVVEVVDIGLDVSRVDATAEIPALGDLVFQPRSPGSYKTKSGHLLVIAGSTQMAGAAVLCCRGALAGGAGLVTLAIPRKAIPRLGTLPPEVMVLEAGDGDVFSPLPAGSLAPFSAIVAGPGIGGGARLPEPVRVYLSRLWRQNPAPVLYDADALQCAQGAGAADRVITPHPGEAGRMLNRSTAQVQADRFACARSMVKNRWTVVLKGRNTVLASDKRRLSINPTGNAVLATGGSGDVLAGVIGALLARGLSGFDAARTGVWAHGRAADLLRAERAEGWTASDVAAAVPRATQEILDAQAPHH